MALKDFTGQNIKDTYQRVVQTHDGTFADGTGSALNILTADQTASFALSNNITGSFTLTSASFSERIASVEAGSTSKTLISSSVQIATDVSGAIDAATSSLLNSYTFVSSSSQIASDISGSWQGQTFISASQVQENIAGGVVSSSAQLAIAISGSWQGQNFISGSQVTENLPTGVISSSQHIFTAITSSGDISASGTGSFSVIDTDIALVNENLFIQSIAFADILVDLTTGSTQFGTSSANTHEFTGSVFISGSNLQFNGVDVLTSSPFTAAGISGSFSSQTSSFVTNSDTASFVTNSDTASFVTNSDTASFVTEIPAGTYSSSLQILGNVTSSGEISASGALFFSSSLNDDTSLVTLMYDTDTGKIFHTGSYGGGADAVGSGFPFAGDAIITGSLTVSGSTTTEDVTLFADVIPGNTDEYTLGTSTKKWNAVFATNTFFGGIHEINLETTGISQLQTGTVLVSKAGQMVPCDTKGDPLVMGISTSGSDYPVVMGAEPVLVDGPVYEGDYIITSNRKGYGTAISPDRIYEQQLFGKIIAQSLETNLSGGSVKAMIRKM